MSEPAQPDNLPDHEMRQLLSQSGTAILQAQEMLASRRTRIKSDDMSRLLAGVIARLETIRLALKGSRG